MQSQERYSEVLRALVLRHGVFVEEVDYCFGSVVMTDPEWHHANSCVLLSTDVPEETTWREFVDTFDGDETVHGVELAGVSCVCGTLTDRKLRWTATMTDVLQAVLDEVMGE